jgi:hypothetical protein
MVPSRNRNRIESSLTNDEYLYLTFLLNTYNSNIQQIRTLNIQTNDIKNRIINLMERHLGLQRRDHANVINEISRRQVSFVRGRDRERNNNYSNLSDISNIFNFDNFFEPVQINPSVAQIENALRVVRYGDIVRPQNISCPISLETFNDDSQVSIIRHCGHIFNTIEINRWFQSNCRCPVCRYDIRNYRIRDSSNNIVQDISSNTLDSNTDLDNNTNLDNSTDLDNSTNNLLTILFSNLLNSTDINSI